MKCIKKIQIEDTIYTANTDFRNIIKCIQIGYDETIGDFERVLGIICTIFGGEGLNNTNHYERLLKWAKNYISCGQEIKDTNKEPDIDYIKDKGLIESSFKFDYKYNPYNEQYLDWQEFYNDLNNLSDSELGNCCALSRARYWRNIDLSKIKDPKEKENAKKMKEYYSLKKNKKQKQYNNEELQNMEDFYKQVEL